MQKGAATTPDTHLLRLCLAAAHWPRTRIRSPTEGTCLRQKQSQSAAIRHFPSVPAFTLHPFRRLKLHTRKQSRCSDPLRCRSELFIPKITGLCKVRVPEWDGWVLSTAGQCASACCPYFGAKRSYFGAKRNAPCGPDLTRTLVYRAYRTRATQLPDSERQATSSRPSE